MDEQTHAPEGDEIGFRRRPVWAVALAALVAVQTVPTAGLFGNDPWDRLTDDAPLVGGRHPLHLYHGWLGARTWIDHGRNCCFDPAFQAGYPKTPLFDAGCRPAELFLLLGGGEFRPAAYKLGLATVCLLVPLVLALAARGCGLGPGAAVLAAMLGTASVWTGPARGLLVDGDLDLVLGGLAVLLQLAALAGFHRTTGATFWSLILLATVVGWFVHPLLCAGFVLLIAGFYLAVAAQHGLGWHLSLFAAWGIGLVGNLTWLADAWRYCWIRLPIPLNETEAAAALPVDWGALLPGTPTDRVMLGGVLVLGLLGVPLMAFTHRKAAAWLVGGGVLGLTAAGIAPAFCPAARDLGADKLLPIAAWFAVAPMVSFLGGLFTLLTRLVRHPVPTAALCVGLLSGGGFAARGLVVEWARTAALASPLPAGLGTERQAVVKTLSDLTTTEARILWEDRPGVRWSALLPRLTGRAFLGGLDPDGGVEYAFARLGPCGLAGRPLTEWADDDLARFARRYNVGWVVCWTAQAAARFRAWPATREMAELSDQGRGWLFEVRRPRSFVLTGKGTWLEASRVRVALSDVVPEEGTVVLSLHHQRGWRVSPGTAIVEAEPDPFDPIPFVRLRLLGPVERLTLVWDDP